MFLYASLSTFFFQSIHNYYCCCRCCCAVARVLQANTATMHGTSTSDPNTFTPTAAPTTHLAQSVRSSSPRHVQRLLFHSAHARWCALMSPLVPTHFSPFSFAVFVHFIIIIINAAYSTSNDSGINSNGTMGGMATEYVIRILELDGALFSLAVLYAVCMCSSPVHGRLYVDFKFVCCFQ